MITSTICVCANGRMCTPNCINRLGKWVLSSMMSRAVTMRCTVRSWSVCCRTSV
ncbi:Uncharacterised protein [Vibrio cholerae]|nr:Uncharacterised protein [Vibrio cholerae]